MGSGKGVRGTGGISAALGTRLPSLAHRLLTRSLSPSLCAVCPPARLLPAAGCLLALSLALPAFAAHAGSYVTANRPDSGKEAHVPRAAALRFGSGHSGGVHSSRVPVPGKGEVRGRVAKAGLLRIESRRDSELFHFLVAGRYSSRKGPYEPCSSEDKDRRRRRAPVTSDRGSCWSWRWVQESSLRFPLPSPVGRTSKCYARAKQKTSSIVAGFPTFLHH